MGTDACVRGRRAVVALFGALATVVWFSNWTEPLMSMLMALDAMLAAPASIPSPQPGQW